jgi:hypothetical protein
MAALSEAYDSVNHRANKNDPYENPQTFQRLVTEVEHPRASRHILGIVGGNEVALARGNTSDLESDLKGITRPNSDCASRHHLPPTSQIIKRSNPKQEVRIDSTPVPMKASQMWGYPSVIAPEPLYKETCGGPQKY